ncbi:hypothetical protein GH714_043094 [Hevea brasiliensis]|uniref:Fibronectin type III-like domain-containing protein n=1 Tax=Hevea brasiliensis TaxID=3981 RepID=A0A6A6K3C9_HEVBR|nr:hypothetical protein GH714_043094 [Hevea brasiliensis]
MAKTFTSLSLIVSVAFLAICTARRPPLVSDVPVNYTHVCEPSRFAKQGLDIAEFGYCDTSQSFEKRAKDLIDRMTLEEKVLQLGNSAAGASKIGLPPYEWWSEALHGVSNTGPGTNFDEVVPGATSFPTVLLTTASFNQSLWKRIGEVVSSEARAMYNLGKSGLTFWSPNINVARDPRWGRILETPGEDPFVVGTYGAIYVRALQDVEGTLNTTDLNSRPLKVAACCKHYTAYDIEDWLGVDRFHFDARVTEQDMLETFQRPFEMCVRDGDASSAMCSFNRVNGIPVCADKTLLQDKIRGQWDLHGYIVSDCDSIEVMVHGQKWLGDTQEDAVSQVLKAGKCIPCRYVSPIEGFSAFAEVTYEMGCADVACKNDSLIFPAMEAAREADATILLVGLDLSVEAEGRDRVDLLLPGYQTQLINQVAKASKGPVILVIMAAGCVDISFAKNNELIQAILWAGYPGQEGGRAIADIVFGKHNPGGRLPLTWYKAEYVDAVPMTSMPLRPVDEFGYPGRTYKFFNGSTVYPFGYGLSYTNFSYKITPSKTALKIKLNKYQHCNNLNYTNDDVKPFCPAVLVEDLGCEHEFGLEATVENAGKMDGSEVVMVYSKPPTGITGTHAKQVIGFERVFVPAGGKNKVKFTFDVCKSLAIVDGRGNKVLPSGLHTIMVGDADVSFFVEVQFYQ